MLMVQEETVPKSAVMSADEFKRAIDADLRADSGNTRAVWYLNIKKFRFINESYGYDKGDAILDEFGSYLVDRISERGICARLSDDRFVVYVSQDGYESDDANTTFESLYREFNLRLNGLGIEHPVDIAAGVYFLTPEDVAEPDVDHIVDQANAAHKRAREQGGNHVILFDYEFAEKQRRANIIEADILTAVQSGEIEVWMQPLIDFVKGEVVSSEALARWNHSTLGSLSPAEFIPVLEESGKIGILDRHVWSVVCYESHNRFLETGEQPVPFSVNVSRAEILDPTLPAFLSGLREKYELPQGTLRLEVTESAYNDKPAELIRAVSNLREKGFIVEMDDFGSGFSSLNMLRNLPVDVLKLDMGFMRTGDSDANDAVILNSVIRMAHGLDIPVIAEGVETIEQAELLKTMGCRFMQGFFFAKPMPLQEFYKLLDDTRSSHHAYSSDDRESKLARLLDSDSDTAFFFNNCVGPAFIYSANAKRYDLMMANDEIYIGLGLKREEHDIFKKPLLKVFDVEGREAFRRATRKAVDNGFAFCRVHLAEFDRWVDCEVRVITVKEGGAVLVCYARDATEVQKLEEGMTPAEAGSFLTHDELTGLLTYHSLDSLVGGDLGEDGGTLLLADIDGFDQFAASHDKEDVDSLVDDIGSTIRSCLAHDALLARCGEGLFAAFLPSVHDEVEARANACRIIEAVRASRFTDEGKVSCSIGLAHLGAGTALRMGIMYRRALRALTIAKINGGDGFLLYETVRAEVDSAIEVFGVELRHAIDGELLPAKALESNDLFNVISRDFEEHHGWGMDGNHVHSVKEAVFGALRYRSMAEVPGVISFDYDVVGDTMYLESVTAQGTMLQRSYEHFAKRVFEFGDNIAPESLARLSTLLEDLAYLPAVGNVDLKCRLMKDGEYRWYRFSFTSLRDEKSFLIRGLGYGEDIDMSRESGLWWKERAMHDGLTGLLNREGLEDAVENSLLKHPGGMMFMIDVDDFKKVNDMLGHLSGDSVLCELADTLLAMFRDHDVVGRYGSDEMIAFIPALCSRHLAHKRCAELLDIIPTISIGSYGSISASIGVAIIDGPATFYDFLELADHAVHISKANGKRQYTIADETESKLEIHDFVHSSHTERNKRGRDQMEIEARFNRERAERSKR